MAAALRFTALEVDKEVTVLRCLRGMIECDPISSREEFSDLMKAAFGNNRLDPRALSDELGYSFSTVYRWIEGRSAPHPSLWPRIAQWVVEALKARLEVVSPLASSEAREHA